MPEQCSSCGGNPVIARGLCRACYRRAHAAGTLPPKTRTSAPPTPRQQFVALCECGCGQPTLLAPYTYHGWGWVKGVPLRFLHNHHTKGERNNHWGDGRYQDKDGYIWIRQPDHPFAKSNGFVQEHRLVVEARLGRFLQPEEIVHHDDENPANNADSNLILTDRPEHARIHSLNEKWSRKHEKCVDCGGTDRPHEAQGYCTMCYQRLLYRSRPA